VSSEQLPLGLPETPRREVSYVFGGEGGYRDQLAERAKSTGLERARTGDPDAFSGAVRAIRDAAAEFGSFTSDDPNWSVRGGEVGAAFAHLRRLGEIEVCGNATWKRQLSHGRLLRVWRRT
jgi:hypothetical protein